MTWTVPPPGYWHAPSTSGPDIWLVSIRPPRERPKTLLLILDTTDSCRGSLARHQSAIAARVLGALRGQDEVIAWGLGSEEPALRQVVGLDAPEALVALLIRLIGEVNTGSWLLPSARSALVEARRSLLAGRDATLVLLSDGEIFDGPALAALDWPEALRGLEIRPTAELVSAHPGVLGTTLGPLQVREGDLFGDSSGQAELSIVAPAGNMWRFDGPTGLHLVPPDPSTGQSVCVGRADEGLVLGVVGEEEPKVRANGVLLEDSQTLPAEALPWIRRLEGTRRSWKLTALQALADGLAGRQAALDCPACGLKIDTTSRLRSVHCRDCGALLIANGIVFRTDSGSSAGRVFFALDDDDRVVSSTPTSPAGYRRGRSVQAVGVYQCATGERHLVVELGLF